MKLNYVKLYGTGASGINEWAAWSEGGVIHIHANGSLYTAKVETNNSGRSLEDQVVLELTARVRKKLDQGFKRTKEELGKHITNQLGLYAPMLATPLERAGGFNKDDCYVQPKLDGHRCLINQDGAYSRRGKVIDTVPEILRALQIPEGATLDGELYCHGVPLQTIASWAKRRQENTLKLKYHVYDIIIPGMPFKERQQILDSLYYGEFIEIVPNMLYDKSRTPLDYCMHYRENGFEGAIIRPGNSKYEIGKRSKSLIKVKMRYDNEFKCVDVDKSADGWGILILTTADGKIFRTSAPGNHDQKRECLNNKEKYIGRYVTCEYAELTNEGIPFHCVAIRWREDI